jgi:hypothetical protein
MGFTYIQFYYFQIPSGFLGATLGGASVSWIGFPWTCTLVAALHVAWVRKEKPLNFDDYYCKL